MNIVSRCWTCWHYSYSVYFSVCEELKYYVNFVEKDAGSFVARQQAITRRPNGVGLLSEGCKAETRFYLIIHVGILPADLLLTGFAERSSGQTSFRLVWAWFRWDPYLPGKCPLFRRLAGCLWKRLQVMLKSPPVMKTRQPVHQSNNISAPPCLKNPRNIVCFWGMIDGNGFNQH